MTWQMLIQLRSAWGEHPAGSLLAAPTPLLGGPLDAPAPEAPPKGLSLLFRPTDRVAIERGGLTKTRNKLIIELLDEVRYPARSRAYQLL